LRDLEAELQKLAVNARRARAGSQRSFA
jgi:hypothetical protein